MRRVCALQSSSIDIRLHVYKFIIHLLAVCRPLVSNKTVFREDTQREREREREVGEEENGFYYVVTDSTTCITVSDQVTYIHLQWHLIYPSVSIPTVVEWDLAIIALHIWVEQHWKTTPCWHLIKDLFSGMKKIFVCTLRYFYGYWYSRRSSKSANFYIIDYVVPLNIGVSTLYCFCEQITITCIICTKKHICK